MASIKEHTIACSSQYFSLPHLGQAELITYPAQLLPAIPMSSGNITGGSAAEAAANSQSSENHEGKWFKMPARRLGHLLAPRSFSPHPQYLFPQSRASGARRKRTCICGKGNALPLLNLHP